jgi:hypothetical protein
MRHTLAIVVSILILLPCARTSFAADWKSISGSDNRVIFYPFDEKGLAIKHSSKGWDDAYTYRQWYLEMVGSETQRRLHVWFTDLAGGRHFPTSRQPKSLIMNYSFFKNRAPTGLQNGTSSTAVGSTPYIKFAVEDQFCIVFEQTFGQSWTMTTSSGTMRLNGFYCEEVGETLTETRIAKILARIGVKDVGVPNIALKKADLPSADGSTQPISRVTRLEDKELCKFAVRKTKAGVNWEDRGSYKEHISVAKERGFSLAECAKLAGFALSTVDTKGEIVDSEKSVEDRLLQLKNLLSKKLITREAYDEKVKKLLEDL